MFPVRWAVQGSRASTPRAATKGGIRSSSGSVEPCQSHRQAPSDSTADSRKSSPLAMAVSAVDRSESETIWRIFSFTRGRSMLWVTRQP